jgi:hypothetical protein
MRNRIVEKTERAPLTLGLQTLTILMVTLALLGLIAWMAQLPLVD